MLEHERESERERERTHVLEGLDELLEERDRLLLELAREELARAVVLRTNRSSSASTSSLEVRERERGRATHLADLLDLCVVVEEEGEVLEADVDVRVAAELAVLLDRRLPARERVLVDFGLNLLGRVGHVDRALDGRRAHLALGAEQRRDELCVDEGRLLVLEALRALARQAEVRVLVDRARDQAGDVGLVAKDLRERVGEGRRCLDRDKVPLADVVAARGRGASVRERGREEGQE